MDRRDFFKTAAVGGVVAMATGSMPEAQRAPAARDDRAFWVDVLRRIADPVLTNLAGGTLKARMPVEQTAGGARQVVTHLEALGRLVAGIAPWIELAADDTPEGRL